MRLNRAGAVVAVLAVLGVLSALAPARAASGSGGGSNSSGSAFAAPVYNGDFPDPAIILSGGKYWSYGTGTRGTNLQVMSSSDLQHWAQPTDPLPVLPSWAMRGLTWAPGVIQVGSNYLMYYTVHSALLGIQCVSVATSFEPQGPFLDTSPGPLVCQRTNGGSIDPNPFFDDASRQLYLLWKSDDNAIGSHTHIWGRRLSPDGRSFAPGSSPSLLLSQSAPWQAPTVEGPTVIHSGGRYYLFYGANSYDTASSGIGYATSPSLLGAYANQSVLAPWVGTTGNAKGPQGPSVFKDSSGGARMTFAAWSGTVGYENGGVRSMWIGRLGFTASGAPTLK